MIREQHSRRKILICFWGSLLFLSACSLRTPQEKAAVRDTAGQGCEEYAVEPARQGYEEYAAVLLEDAEFFDATAQEYRHLSDYMPPIFRHRLLNTSDFCLSDIDSDGVNEVFLQYDSLDSYLVFDYEDDTVYGYCFYQHELQYLEYYLEIYEDIGPCIELRSDGTFCKIRFSRGEYELIPIPEPDSEHAAYAEWYAFTKENLLEVFLPDELDAYLAEQEALAAEWTSGWKEEGDAWEAFYRVLNGDFTLIADVESRYQLAGCYWENIEESGACPWKYVLLEDDFGRQSLFIQSGEVYDAGFSALLYYDDGKLICAALDIGDYHDFYVPLQDGRLLYIYDYYPTTLEYIVQIDADFAHLRETEYFLIGIDYDMYEYRDDPNSQYQYFAQNYDVITGIGVYYFVTESDLSTYPAEEMNISANERLEIEKQFDEWIVPDSAWRSCPKKTDTVLLNLEQLFIEHSDHSLGHPLDYLYADFEKNGNTAAFAFNGTIYHDSEKSYSWPFMGFSGSVWYVDTQGCTLLGEEIRTDGYEPAILSYENECHLLYTTDYKDGHYLDNVSSYVWAVRDGEPTLVFETPGFCRMADGKLVCTDTVEAAADADDTTKKRYFYWDAVSGTYKEE